MTKNKFPLILFVLVSFLLSGTVYAKPLPAEKQSTTTYKIYLPIIFKPVPPPPAAPPAYYSTSWYVTPTSSANMYQQGLLAAAKTQPAGQQNQLVILDFGQPWVDTDGRYGTLLLKELYFDLTSMNDIKVYTKNFITGFMAGSDGVSKLELGIGTSNFAKYKESGVCTDLSTFCTTAVAYEHGKQWALMVKDIYTWVVQQGYAGQVSVAGANDIELFWNYASITHAWANGFNDYDSGVYIYYNYGACEGCDIGINLSVPPDPDKDLAYDWTPRKAQYTAWGVDPAWPIPEIYLTSGVHANQWANLSKVSVDIGDTPMYFLSALTQYQACGGGCTDGTDNTPTQAWYQLYEALNKRPETAQYTIPYMTDIDWP